MVRQSSSMGKVNGIQTLEAEGNAQSQLASSARAGKRARTEEVRHGMNK